MEKNSTPIVVVAVAVADAKGLILMQKRPEQAVHAGLWEFPGGKVEPGETPEDAACRELREELGIEARARDLSPVGFASGPAQGARGGPQIVLLLYGCRDWTGVPTSHEGQEIAWLEPQAIPGLDMPPLDYPLARALIRSI